MRIELLSSFIFWLGFAQWLAFVPLVVACQHYLSRGESLAAIVADTVILFVVAVFVFVVPNYAFGLQPLWQAADPFEYGTGAVAGGLLSLAIRRWLEQKLSSRSGASVPAGAPELSTATSTLTTLRVGGGTKVSLYMMSVLAALPVSWVLLRRLQTGSDDTVLVGFVCGLVTIACGWLLSRQSHLCSIVVDKQGISQRFLWKGGRLLQRVHLDWGRIDRASYKRFSYYFIAHDGTIFELNTVLFGDINDMLRAAHTLIPQRLLAQIE